MKTFLAVLSIMLYFDEDYKIKMADTARQTTQEKKTNYEEGMFLSFYRTLKLILHF